MKKGKRKEKKRKEKKSEVVNYTMLSCRNLTKTTLRKEAN